MTSHYVMVTNKLYLDDRNNDYMVLCKLGSHTISGCTVTGVGPPEPPPPPPVLGSKKKPGLNRVNVVLYVMLCKLVIIFQSMGETLVCDLELT